MLHPLTRPVYVACLQMHCNDAPLFVCQHTPPPLLIHCCHSTSTSLLSLSLSLSPSSALPTCPPTKVPLFSFPFLIPARDLFAHSSPLSPPLNSRTCRLSTTVIMGAHSAVWQGTDNMALAILYEPPWTSPTSSLV